MNCSLINNRVNLFLQNASTAISMQASETEDHSALNERINRVRSALQRPELNRAQLAAILRKTLKKQRSSKSQQTHWQAFMKGYVCQNANCNDFSA